jgi:hypothetical protein
MSKMQSTLSHYFDQVSETELVPQIPACAQHDDLTVKIAPRKQPLDAPELRHC